MNTRRLPFSFRGARVGISAALALALGACSPDDPVLGFGQTDPQHDPGSPTNGGILGSTSRTPISRSLDAKPAAKARKRAADKAKAEKAARQISAAQLAGLKPQLQLGEDDTLRPTASERGKYGDVSIRLAHYHKELRVIGSSAIVHIDAKGNIRRVTNAIKPNIGISPSPAIDSQRAIAAVMADPERLPYHEPPEAALAILPLRERVLKATGLPPDPKNGELNADQLERRVRGYQLVYTVDTDEENRLASPRYRNMHYVVDAHTGQILEQRSLNHYSSPDSNEGIAMYAYPFEGVTYPMVYDQTVILNTVLDGPINYMFDPYKEFAVLDDAFIPPAGSNSSADDAIWGDGVPWASGSPSNMVHRQTSIVDAKYALEVVYDLFDTVFEREDIFTVDCYVHVEEEEDVEWDNAEYTVWNNINVGDGPKRTSLTTLAHEFGHAFDDDSANLLAGSDGETLGLKEAAGDITAVMTTFYVYTRGLWYGTDYIPDPPVPSDPNPYMETGLNTIFFWKTIASSRVAYSPTFPYWFSSIGSEDQHDALGPMVRAFYFLAAGSSWNTTPTVTSPTALTASTPYRFSYVIPSGMEGIGIDAASKIFYRAMTAEFNDDTTYDEADAGLIAAAEDLFGTGNPEPPEVTAVRNAVAAANFGPRPGDYPMPATDEDTEPNQPQNTNIQILTKPADDNPLTERPTRLEVTGTAEAEELDWYRVRVPNGYGLKITLIPTWGQDVDLYVYEQGTTNSIGDSVAADETSQPEVVRIPLTYNGGAGYTDFDILIQGVSGTHGGYRLYLDWMKFCSGTQSSEQIYSPTVVGCAAQETVANKESLCSPNAHVCTSAEWAAHLQVGSPAAPSYNYWLGDTISKFTGTPTDCAAFLNASSSCGFASPIRICADTQVDPLTHADPLGNNCNVVTHCGLSTNDPDRFLGCGSSSGNAAKAGALCCSNS